MKTFDKYVYYVAKFYAVRTNGSFSIDRNTYLGAQVVYSTRHLLRENKIRNFTPGFNVKAVTASILAFIMRSTLQQLAKTSVSSWDLRSSEFGQILTQSALCARSGDIAVSSVWTAEAKKGDMSLYLKYSDTTLCWMEDEGVFKMTFSMPGMKGKK
jgi:hypothetical protein